MTELTHLVRIEGTTERLRGIRGLENVETYSSTSEEAGPTRYSIYAVATDDGLSELQALGLDVEVVEEAAARAARLDAMARDIREAGAE